MSKTKRKEKFTPGPWEVSVGNSGSIFGDIANDIHDGDHPYIGTVDGIGTNVDGDNTDTEECKANAKLIEKAPDMYYMLDEIFIQGKTDAKSLKLVADLLNEIRDIN